MNAKRVAALLRELADELEREDVRDATANEPPAPLPTKEELRERTRLMLRRKGIRPRT